MGETSTSFENLGSSPAHGGPWGMNVGLGGVGMASHVSLLTPVSFATNCALFSAFRCASTIGIAAIHSLRAPLRLQGARLENVNESISEDVVRTDLQQLAVVNQLRCRCGCWRLS